MNANDKLVQKLVEYLLGDLEPKEAEEVEKVLKRDPNLRDLLNQLKETRDESAEIGWHSLRPSVHSLLSSQLREIKARKGRAGNKQAVTVYDSGLLPLPQGVRPASVDTRRVKYSVADKTLEISMYPVSRESYEIIGYLSGMNQGQILKADLIGNDARYSAESNQHQVFRFPRVQTDNYRIKISHRGSIVAVANLEL